MGGDCHIIIAMCHIKFLPLNKWQKNLLLSQAPFIQNNVNFSKIGGGWGEGGGGGGGGNRKHCFQASSMGIILPQNGTNIFVLKCAMLTWLK